MNDAEIKDKAKLLKTHSGSKREKIVSAFNALCGLNVDDAKFVIESAKRGKLDHHAIDGIISGYEKNLVLGLAGFNKKDASKILAAAKAVELGEG